MHSRKFKLLLINPISRYRKGFIINRSTQFEPIGLAIIAALTPANWDVEILDENFETFSYKPADFVGLTAFTSTAPRAYEIAKEYRARGIPTVIGGVHATMLPDEAGQYVNTVVTGEAESIWHQVISDFEEDKLKKRYHGEFIDMKYTPIPRRDLINPNYVHASVMTTRGCPMDCDFCSVSAFNGTKFRMRPVENILAELEQIPKKRIFFIDDNMIGFSHQSIEHAKELFRGMIERKLNKEWFTQLSLNYGNDPELVRLAAKSGCRLVLIGIESDKEKILQDINKTLNLKIGIGNYGKYFRRVHHEGISIIGTFIFGMDDDTPDDMMNRARFIMRSGLDTVQATILTPLPGTRLYDRIAKENRLLYANYPDDWTYYNEYCVTIKPRNMPVETLSLTMTRVWKKIYSKNNIRWKFIMTFLRCWNLNLYKWASRGLNAALWAYFTNWNYKRIVEQYYNKQEIGQRKMSPVIFFRKRA